MTPEEAFAVLGEETRLEILRALGDAEGPLSFSDLFDRVEYDDSSNFTYHLEKLVGHFVRKTDCGYELRQPGARVVEAVLSGVIDETPTIEPTRIDHECLLCGAPAVVHYREDVVGLYCTECDGMYGHPDPDDPTVPDELADCGDLGGYPLPPSGLQGRTPTDAFEAAETWEMSQVLSWGSGVCPRCTAPMEREVRVCEDHDGTADRCSRCGRRYAVLVDGSCTNCPRKTTGLAAHYLLPNTEFLSFLTSNGVNPVSPMPEFYRVLIDHEEHVVSTDPLDVRLTFTVGDESITFAVDEDLSITDATRDRPSGGG